MIRLPRFSPKAILIAVLVAFPGTACSLAIDGDGYDATACGQAWSLLEEIKPAQEDLNSASLSGNSSGTGDYDRYIKQVIADYSTIADVLISGTKSINPGGVKEKIGKLGETYQEVADSLESDRRARDDDRYQEDGTDMADSTLNDGAELLKALGDTTDDLYDQCHFSG